MTGVFVQVNEESPFAKSKPIGYVVQENGCWDWVGSRNKQGYGVWAGAKSSGRSSSTAAYRVMYEMHKGPIPKGLTIDHLCRNKACVNPDHLEAVTQRENNWRHSRVVSAAKQRRREAIHAWVESGKEPEDFYVHYQEAKS